MLSLANPLALLLLPLPILAHYLLSERQADSGALHVPASIAARLNSGATEALRARARRFLPAILWITLVFALAGPRVLTPTPALPASGRDIVLAIDLSGSMEQEDFELDGQPVQRLDAVKRVAARFVRGRAGDRVGLVIFAETAYFAVPPTYDVEAVARGIEEATIGISGRSTAIADGLGLAMKRLAESDAPSKVVILLSDGVDSSGTVDPIAAGELAGRLGIRVHSIALGPRDLSNAGTSRDVVDAATLRSVSQSSGGTAFRVRNTADLEAVDAAIDALEAGRAPAPAVEIHRDLWIYPAAAGFVIALLMLVGDRRSA